MGQRKTEFIQNIKPEPLCPEIIIRPASPLPTPQYPTFPLPHPPNCPCCGEAPRKRENILRTNLNGNAGRPYYCCKKCVVTGGWVWITWDDYRGVYSTNPECDCGLVSRRDRAGARTASAGCEFWKCALGRCGYWERVPIEEQVCEDDIKTEGNSRVKIKVE